MTRSNLASINVKVVGVGGAGGNALHRMAGTDIQGVEFLAFNTDIQALRQIKRVRTFAIGPDTTGGLGSGGRPEVGRKAMKESHQQVSQLLEDSDMVFIAAGLGGGTGTGAAGTVAEIAKKHGALTVGVVTLPFSFEGPRRMAVAMEGLDHIQRRVDTLITVDNNALLRSLKGQVSLEAAFRRSDDVLRQGVQGVSDIVMVPGLINVDFADVRSIMANGGPSFMSVGEGKGRWAAIEAAHMAVSNPLFDAPLEGATGVLFNVTGGKDLTLGQVHEVASIIGKSTRSDANVIFGVVQQKHMGRRVVITLVATGIGHAPSDSEPPEVVDHAILKSPAAQSLNGHTAPPPVEAERLL